jgi:hypothetical protein
METSDRHMSRHRFGYAAGRRNLTRSGLMTSGAGPWSWLEPLLFQRPTLTTMLGPQHTALRRSRRSTIQRQHYFGTTSFSGWWALVAVGHPVEPL